MKSSASKTKKTDMSGSKTQPPGSEKAVFMMRAEGQSFDDFSQKCIEALEKAGLLEPEPPPDPLEKRYIEWAKEKGLSLE